VGSVSVVRTKQQLEAGEWAVLALLAEQPTHGFAIARELSSEGELGRVWTLPRPLVYRALETLQRLGLAEPVRVVASDRGPKRTIIRATPSGLERVAGWLDEPVEHVREVRSLFMLKLAFRSRRGLPLASLLTTQRAAVEPVVDALEARASEEEGFGRALALWRFEAAAAVLRFLDGLLERERSAAGAR
jgi:PadR family transcriptional regulator AphA